MTERPRPECEARPEAEGLSPMWFLVLIFALLAGSAVWYWGERESERAQEQLVDSAVFGR